MEQLRNEVRRQLDAWEQDLGHPLWTESDILVVGVSGGPDSLSLLHLLVKGNLHAPSRVVVGHLNHRLRPSATDEANFVAQLCGQWGLECQIGEVDVAALADRNSLTIEEAARVARYRFLGRLARDAGSGHVMVGHTADDQAETVLMHFVRGAGLSGLRGMAPDSALHGYLGIRLVRPLLNVRREQVLTYCRRFDLEPVYDPSNEDLTFFRNRLRHELLPLLETYNPQIRERLLRTADVVRADVAFLESETEDALSSLQTEHDENSILMELELWRALPLSLRRRTLRQAVWQLRKSLRDVSYAPLEQARRVAEQGPVGAESGLPGNLVLEVEYDSLRLYDPESDRKEGAPQLPPGSMVALVVPGTVDLENGWQLHANVGGPPAQEEPIRERSSWQEAVDADRAGDLVVRTRQVGERLQPLGMGGKSTKISDLMINEKVPARLRDGWPIVANAQHAVWVVGLRLDQRVCIRDRSQRVIQLRCVRKGA